MILSVEKTQGSISHDPMSDSWLSFPVVTELPVKWLKELDEDTSPLKGQPLYMTCELNKERDVIWKRNGEVLKKKAGKIQINIIGMQHAVTIQNTAAEDTGLYTCEVANQEDVKTTTNVKVIGKKKQNVEHSNMHQYSCLQRWSSRCMLV